MALGIYNGIASDNAQNLVPVEVQNSKSLTFDGTDQFLTTTADSTLATKTYSFWAKSSDTTHNTKNGVFDHGEINRGAFYFNWNNSRPLIYIGGPYRYFNDISAQDDGSWHHWMVLLDSDITATKLFCDGSEVSAYSTNTVGATLDYTTGIRLGRGDSYYFSGHLDEFAIFDGDKTGIAADIYNNGVPTDLTGTAGLEHWWRMGDATEPAADGTGSHTNKLHILDQANTTLGSEMVIADAYVADEWYAYANTTMTFGDNFMRCEHDAAGDSNGWFTYLRTSASDNSILTATPTTDSFYLLTFDVESDDADAYVYMKLGNVASTILQGTGDGTKTVVYKKGSSAHMDYLEGRNLSQGKYMKISNVSVKEILGATAEMTNMAGSDIVQYTPNSYILSDLGITPDLAVSMTRKLVSDYSGSFYATSGSDVTTIYDQSGNSRNLTNYGSGDEVTLSGSGNLARAVFSSTSNSVLTTDTLGSAFPAGNHDVFMVFDPVGTDQQILFGRASTGGDFLAMDNGSGSNASNGITIGEIRVNDAVLSATVTRNALWDAMTVAGTMSGLNVLSLEDVDLSTIGGHIRLGASNNTWRLEGYFAEFIITPPLTDAEHSAVVENIRAHYDAP